MSGLMNPAQWLLDFFGGGKKVVVNGETIFKLGPVWYAINRIAGHVGQLPIDCKRYLPRGSETVYNHPGHRLLRVRPNGYQTPFIFKELLEVHALLWGNGRSAIYRENGLPKELLPMLPDRSLTFMVKGEKYHVTKPHIDDPINGRKEAWDTLEEVVDDGVKPIDRGLIVMHDRDVLHLQGLGFDGVEGKSLIQVGAESFGN